MAPPTKRPKTSRAPIARAPSPAFSSSSSHEDSGSEDEWAAERERVGGAQSSSREEEDSEDEDGVAQFESDEGEDMEDSEEDEEAALGKQLSSIPFGSLMKAKRKLSNANARASTSAVYSDEEEEEEDTSLGARKGRVKKPMTIGEAAQSRRANGSLRKADRASKHAPMEMSSKRAVGRSRTIVETRADKARDPRFDSLSGNFKPDLFRASYSFLSAAQTTELDTLRKTAAAARKNVMLPEEEKEKIEAALVRMQSREVARKTKEREGDALRDWKKEEEKKVEGGKKKFYLKKTDQRAVVLKAKYEALSKDKKVLRKAVEKKRRKTTQQDKRLIPSTR